LSILNTIIVIYSEKYRKYTNYPLSTINEHRKHLPNSISNFKKKKEKERQAYGFLIAVSLSSSADVRRAHQAMLVLPVDICKQTRIKNTKLQIFRNHFKSLFLITVITLLETQKVLKRQK